MRIKYLGHSAFVLTSEEGTRVVLDPYKAGAFDGALGYPPIDETAEVVLRSHSHEDHGYAEAVKGNPEVVSLPESRSFGNIHISGVETFHDEAGGSERGGNVVFTAEIDGVKVTHLGDLGHALSERDAEEIGQPDILLVPVGGFFTIDATTADRVIEKLNPTLVIPMHYKTECCGFPIAPVEGFLKGREHVRKVGREVTISKSDLPQEFEIWVMEHPTA